MAILKQRISMIIKNFPKIQSFYGSIFAYSTMSMHNILLLYSKLKSYAYTTLAMKVHLAYTLIMYTFVKPNLKLKNVLLYYLNVSCFQYTKMSNILKSTYTLKLNNFVTTTLKLKITIATYYKWEDYENTKWEDLDNGITNEEFIRYTFSD